MKYYAGIGSRETPDSILDIMKKLSQIFQNKGFVLNSGGANGADKAFAEDIHLKQIFIPWNGFNGLYHNGKDVILEHNEMAGVLASELHPAWNKCSQGAKKLHQRNIHQILGRDLDTLVSFVVCYTKDAKLQGGTATAIRLANLNNIKVINLGNPDTLDKVIHFIENYSS